MSIGLDVLLQFRIINFFGMKRLIFCLLVGVNSFSTAISSTVFIKATTEGNGDTALVITERALPGVDYHKACIQAKVHLWE